MIGSRLKEEREKLGMTQPAFAQAAGAAKRTLIDWEKGVSSPNAVQLSALKKIGVDVLYVLTGDSPDPGRTMAAYADSPEGRQLLHDVTFGNVPGKAPAAPSGVLGEVVTLPVSDSGSLTWRRILVIAIDELNAAGKRLPGEKLLELVDLLMAWQAEGAKVDAEKLRRQIRLVA